MELFFNLDDLWAFVLELNGNHFVGVLDGGKGCFEFLMLISFLVIVEGFFVLDA